MLWWAFLQRKPDLLADKRKLDTLLIQQKKPYCSQRRRSKTNSKLLGEKKNVPSAFVYHINTVDVVEEWKPIKIQINFWNRTLAM
ncbi:hypothetical protein TNCV_4494091 [Trichonephila clavipes]|nr:hypothetical protein TNCV_4494091 [Trichonephila clavipes]